MTLADAIFVTQADGPNSSDVEIVMRIEMGLVLARLKCYTILDSCKVRLGA